MGVQEVDCEVNDVNWCLRVGTICWRPSFDNSKVFIEI
jgi:hypothetical protein